MGAIGVTGSSAANTLAKRPTSSSRSERACRISRPAPWALFQNDRKTIIALNMQLFDATKHCALPLSGDADAGLKMLAADLGAYRAPDDWVKRADDSRGKMVRRRRAQ